MANDTFRLSIALITRNRPSSLERALRSVRSQDVLPFEVVVSDDSSPEHATRNQRLASDFGFQYFEGPRRGLYANRNAVALACQGDHIHTMDDDHELPTSHIAICSEAIKLDPDSIWVIGEHYPETLECPVPPPMPSQIQPRGFSVPPTDPSRSWAIADGSTIFPRSIFARGLRYSEAFRFGSAFYEFGSYLFWLGYRSQFLSRTYVLHHSKEFADNNATVWTEGSQVALASRYYAMLCHSFIYQTTPRNKLETCFQISKEYLCQPMVCSQAIRLATAAFREQRKVALCFARYSPGNNQ